MNLIGSARSNLFRVKDRAAFLNWAGYVPDIEVAEHMDGRFAIFSCSDTGTWPSYEPDEDDEDQTPYDVGKDLVQHLADGEVAILMEVSYVGQRSVAGAATALHSDGRVMSVDIWDIYKMVKDQWNVEPARAEA